MGEGRQPSFDGEACPEPFDAACPERSRRAQGKLRRGAQDASANLGSWMSTTVEARLGPIEQVHRVRRGLRRGQLIGAVSLSSIGVLAGVVAAYPASISSTESRRLW